MCHEFGMSLPSRSHSLYEVGLVASFTMNRSSQWDANLWMPSCGGIDPYTLMATHGPSRRRWPRSVTLPPPDI
jgi:hypothetical protein